MSLIGCNAEYFVMAIVYFFPVIFGLYFVLDVGAFIFSAALF